MTPIHCIASLAFGWHITYCVVARSRIHVSVNVCPKSISNWRQRSRVETTRRWLTSVNVGSVIADWRMVENVEVAVGISVIFHSISQIVYFWFTVRHFEWIQKSADFVQCQTMRLFVPDKICTQHTWITETHTLFYCQKSFSRITH